MVPRSPKLSTADAVTAGRQLGEVVPVEVYPTLKEGGAGRDPHLTAPTDALTREAAG